MTSDSTLQSSDAKAAYEARPWLKHYSSYVQPELTTHFANGLEMFLATVKAAPDEIMEDLPKTTTGKFLRRELRDKARH